MIKAKAAGKPYSKGSREAKRRRDRKRTQRRRALVQDPEADVIDRDEVGERDGWVCRLCFVAVDRQLEYPDADSPSLDHIVPLSLGGKHAYFNVQIAHLHCNFEKGARISSDGTIAAQLATALSRSYFAGLI